VTEPRRRRRRRYGPDRGPTSVADDLDRVVARMGTSEASTLGLVFTRWEEIVGPVLAGHVKPIRVSDDTLVVAVEQPAWATQVRSLGATLLTRVGEVTGTVPTRLEVTVRRA
jgi:predicted nucleic acid-binding Zn ribbon protein